MPSAGQRNTPRVSHHESLGDAHSGAADARRLHAVDAESAATASGAVAQPRRSDDDRDIKHSLKRHWLAVAVLFLVASAWGATFTLVKQVLTRIAPEPFIFLRFTAAGIVLLAVAIAMR